jgi:hypothetical protein
MKMHILPPARVKIGNTYLWPAGNVFVTAWSVVFEVAAGYRYWRGITSEAQRDLLRFASLNLTPVYVGVKDGRTPVFYFDREMASAWLDDGGRSWIVGELEARSSRRVVAFPGNEGPRERH